MGGPGVWSRPHHRGALRRRCRAFTPGWQGPALGRSPSCCTLMVDLLRRSHRGSRRMWLGPPEDPGAVRMRRGRWGTPRTRPPTVCDTHLGTLRGRGRTPRTLPPGLMLHTPEPVMSTTSPAGWTCRVCSPGPAGMARDCAGHQLSFGVGCSGLRAVESAFTAPASATLNPPLGDKATVLEHRGDVHQLVPLLQLKLRPKPWIKAGTCFSRSVAASAVAKYHVRSECLRQCSVS